MEFKPQSVLREAVSWQLRNKKSTNIFRTQIVYPPPTKAQLKPAILRFDFIEERTGATRFYIPAEDGYSIPSDTFYALRFMGREHLDGSIEWHYWKDYTTFSPNRAGTYQINTEVFISISDPATRKTTDVELWLYRNGSVYARLDWQPMYVVIDITSGSYYFFPAVSLQGSIAIELAGNDYIELRIIYSRLATGIDWIYPYVSESGYVDFQIGGAK